MTRAFIFPGQGSQVVGMGKAMAEIAPAARHVFAEVDDAPGLGGLHLLLLLVGAVPALLVVVLRALLQQATTLRTDLEAVI